MKKKKDSAGYKYMNVANSIVEEVCAKLSPGDKFPPVEDLCEKYGVSQITIKKALEILVQHGLIKRIPRKGTIMLRAVDDDNALPEFSRRATLKILAPHEWRFSDCIDVLAKKFAAIQNVNVEVVRANRPECRDRLKNEKFDLVLVYSWAMRQFMTEPGAREMFVPVGEVPGLWLDEDEYFPQVIDACRNESGEVMCLPVNFSTVVNCINLEYPGLKDAQALGGCSMTDFAAQLKKMKHKKDGVNSYPFLLPVTWNRWPLVVQSFGGEIFSPDGRMCLLDSPEAVEAIRFMVDMMYKSRVCLPLDARQDFTRGDVRGLFALGSFLCSWVTYSMIHNNLPFKCCFTKLPAQRRRATYLQVEGVMVPGPCTNAALIKEFLNFLQTGENQHYMSDNSDSFSAQKKFAEMYMALREKEYPGISAFIDALPDANVFAASPCPEVMAFIDDMLYPVWVGIEPVAETCKKLARQATEMLGGKGKI